MRQSSDLFLLHHGAFFYIEKLLYVIEIERGLMGEANLSSCIRVLKLYIIMLFMELILYGNLCIKRDYSISYFFYRFLKHYYFALGIFAGSRLYLGRFALFFLPSV